MNHKLPLDLHGVQFADSLLHDRQTAPLSIGLGLDSGCHAVVMQTSEQADSFILSCAGLKPALRGRVKMGSEDPYTTPKLRAQIVSVLAQEFDLEYRFKHGKCSDLFAYLLSIEPTLWNQTHRARLLERLAPFRDRPSHSLTNDERRLIMLEYALAHPSPKLALLYEPWTVILALNNEAPERRLLDELNRLVQSGCVVILLTLDEDHAARYSGHVVRPIQLHSSPAPLRAFFRSVL